MGKVVGRAGEEKEVMNWYEKELGFDMTDYGTGFTEGRQLVLLSFKRGDKPNTIQQKKMCPIIPALLNKFPNSLQR